MLDIKLIAKYFTLHLLCLMLTGCLPYQAFLYTVPDEKDIKRFKHETVPGATTCFSFHKPDKNHPIHITNWDSKEPLEHTSLDLFLKKHKTKYFLVVKNDSIVYDYIHPKIKKYEPVPSFSVSKSFVSALIGIAIEQGLIQSVEDKVQQYLPELNYHDNFADLTINHLLNQKSGLKKSVTTISDAYYGKVEKVLHRLRFIAPPGERFEYININYTLLGIILERVSGKDLHLLFSEHIWSKIGTCNQALWGYDYRTNHTRAIGTFAGSVYDYAKFGRLYLKKGNWEGSQLIDSTWIATSINPTNALGEKSGYNNSWYIGEKEIGDFLAIGMYRQQVYVNPNHNVVIVSLMKFRKKNLDVRWWQVLRQITDQIE